MIFYGQDEEQIVFLLDGSVANAIADWNCCNQSQLKLEDYEYRKTLFPRFQITLCQTLNQIDQIEIEQVHPKTKQGEALKQCVAAQRIDGLLSFIILDFQGPRSEASDYKLSTPILKLDLVEYFYLINDWREWTRETALSGRYIYGFGPLDVTAGMNGWIEYFADGWIKDTISGVALELYHRYPSEIM